LHETVADGERDKLASAVGVLRGIQQQAVIVERPEVQLDEEVSGHVADRNEIEVRGSRKRGGSEGCACVNGSGHLRA